MNENEMSLFLDGETRRECPTQTDSQQRLVLWYVNKRGSWGLLGETFVAPKR